MSNFEVPKNTSIRLVEDISSLDFDDMMIPRGTLGTIVDFERHPVTNEIIGYYANIYALSEEYLCLDSSEFEVVDESDDDFDDFNFDRQSSEHNIDSE